MHRKWFRALFQRRMFIALLILLQMAFFVYLILDTSAVSSVLASAFQVFSLLVALYIVSKKGKGAFKLTWVFLILCFPLFGGMLYLLFRIQSDRSPLARPSIRIEKAARPFYLMPGDCYAQAAASLPDYAPQLHYLQAFAGFPVYDATESTYYPSGKAMWRAMLSELEKAEHYIFLEFFIIEEGEMWDAILEVLCRKAKQGVSVRMIYDDFGCFLKLPKDYPAQMKQHGIECMIFNPFQPVFSVHQNNRDHRKILSIDGKTVFTGGANLADEYINAIEKHGTWKDSAIRLSGKAAWSMTVMFLQSFSLCKKEPVDFASYYPKETEIPLHACGFVQPYADSPMDKDNVGEHVYLHMIQAARQYLYITTPYLIIDDSMLSALTLASKSGVDVKIITPHIGDKRIVHATTRSYYRELIKAGVQIYEYEQGFIHQKTFVCDDRTATVGTTNLDFRSLYMHFECGVRLYDCPTVYAVKEDFLETLKVCKQITVKDCSRYVLTGLFQDILRLFAPLM